METPEENPTAAILMRFANKSNLDVQQLKQKQRDARHQISEQARRLTDAVKKEDKRQTQLKEARQARKKKEE